MGRFVKRYYKKIMEDKLDIQKEQNPLPKKVQRFRKGLKQKHKSSLAEKFHPQIREERVLSTMIRPNLVFLNDMLPLDGEDDSSCYARLRANTLKVK